MDLYEVYPTIAKRSESEGTDESWEKRQRTYKLLDYDQAFYIVNEVVEMLESWVHNYQDVAVSGHEMKCVAKEVLDCVKSAELLIELSKHKTKIDAWKKDKEEEE